ncbi:RidA family protein [Enterococcus larvae]|uniref:RidA family protein n=1 Tax=Enterococcus larvae TaxID=2794352 RepID=UPI003F382C8D
MSEIIRKDINEEWAHTGVVKAGDFIFTSYCVGNIGESIEKQINGAFDVLEERLAMFGLTVDSVVKIDALFRDIWDIPTMEKVLKERFKSGNYPVRKSIQTEFAHKGGENGLLFQLDATAYAGDK